MPGLQHITVYEHATIITNLPVYTYCSNSHHHSNQRISLAPLSTERPRPGASRWCDLAQIIPKLLLYGSPNQIQSDQRTKQCFKPLPKSGPPSGAEPKRWPESELEMS